MKLLREFALALLFVLVCWGVLVAVLLLGGE